MVVGISGGLFFRFYYRLSRGLSLFSWVCREQKFLFRTAEWVVMVFILRTGWVLNLLNPPSQGDFEGFLPEPWGETRQCLVSTGGNSPESDNLITGLISNTLRVRVFGTIWLNLTRILESKFLHLSI